MNYNDTVILTTGIGFGIIIGLFIGCIIYLYMKEKKKNVFKYGCANCKCKKFKLIGAYSRTVDGVDYWTRDYKCSNCELPFSMNGKISNEEANIIFSCIRVFSYVKK